MQGVACRVLLDGSVCCCLDWRVRFRCIAWCCFKVLLAGLLVPVQGAAAGCCCRVLLQGAASTVRVEEACCRMPLGCALWSWHVGAVLESRVRFGCGMVVRLQVC